jgi:hypothetical protein
VAVGGGTMVIDDATVLAAGAEARVAVPAAALHLFPAASGARSMHTTEEDP